MRLTASAKAARALRERKPRTTLPDRLIEGPRRLDPQQPTRERLNKSANGWHVGTQTGTRRENTPLELYAKDLKAEQITAAHWYIDLASRVNAYLAAPAAGYDGIRNTAFGPTDGRVHDGDRQAFGEFYELRDWLTDEEMAALDALVASTRDAQLLSVADFGAQKMATLIDHATCKGFGIAAMFYSLERVVEWRRERRRHNLR